MHECLDQLEKFLHQRELPSLVHIALCHYQLEAIHPFLDGNGRLGRLLIILMLLEHSRLPGPLLYLSAFFEASRQQYYHLLYAVSTQGAWQAWLRYFLQGVALQAEDVLERAAQMNEWLQQAKLKVASGSSQVALHLVEQLGFNPYLTIRRAAEQLKVAYSTAQRAVQKLEGAGLLQRVGGQQRDRAYCATELLAILEAPAKLVSSLTL